MSSYILPIIIFLIVIYDSIKVVNCQEFIDYGLVYPLNFHFLFLLSKFDKLKRNVSKDNIMRLDTLVYNSFSIIISDITLKTKRIDRENTI